MNSERDLRLLRAHGRCLAALIFSFFGACWLLLSCTYAHRLHLLTVLPICVVAGLLAAAAWRLRRRHGPPALEGTLKQQKQREDRIFGYINAVTYGAVFLLFLLLPHFGLENYVFPAFVALVGLHFFPMPPLYRHTANLITGAFLVVWAVFCAVAFRANGYTMAINVALGAGLALWCSSLSAILTANRLFRQAGLTAEA